MTNACLKCYYEEHWQAIQQHAGEYVLAPTGKKLHHLRVAIKQVYALIHLFRACGEGQQLKLKPLQQLFKQAGRLRDLQVARKMLRHYHIGAKARKHEQQDSIRKLAGFYQRLAAYSSRREALHKAILRQLGRVKPECVAAEYAHQLVAAVRELAGKAQFKPWHSARKRLKFLWYFHSLLYPDSRKQVAPEVRTFDVLQNRLGQWRNARRMEKQLAASRHSQQAVLKSLRKRRKKLQQAVRAQLPALLPYVKRRPASTSDVPLAA